MATKPPRPAAPVGAWLLVAGAAAVITGTFLTWLSIEGLGASESANGFTDNETGISDGPIFVGLGVILAGLGAATLAARRNLAVAIISVVLASFTVLAALADLGEISSRKDDLEALGVDPDFLKIGPGIPVILVGALLALAGSIVVLAKRRR